jgi:hypothetical protein
MATINNRFENLTLERLQEIYDLITAYPPGSAVWGSITGTLALQTDLQTALNGKFNNPTGTVLQYIRGNGTLANFPSALLVVGSSPITTGVEGRILFQGTGNVLQQSGNLFWDQANARLGIGTATPQAKLEVFGTNELLRFGDGTSGNDAFISFNSRGFIGFKGSGGLNFIANTTRPIIFGVGANFSTFTEAARFAASTGNFLINTTTDAGFRLDVNGTARIQGETTIGNGTDSVIRANSASTGNFNTIQLIANTSNNSTMFEVRPNGTSTDLTGFLLRDSATAAANSNVVIIGRGNATLPSTGVSYYGTLVANNVNANSLHLGFLVSSVSLGRIEAARIWNSGNVTIQNGGTFTDAGYRLDVVGSTRVSGSISAASLLARGTFLNQTLVATANNDVLVGLDIQPTFTTGAFTGTTSAALRVNGNIIPTFGGSGSLGTAQLPFNNALFSGTVFSNNIQAYSSHLNFNTTSFTTVGRFFSGTGNLTLQNGGTFTDAGFRLDVNGIVRTGLLTITGSTASTGISFTNGNWALGSANGSFAFNGNVGFDTYSNTTTPIRFYQTGVLRLSIAATTGNLLVGNIADAGFRLDVGGSTKLRTDTFFGSIAQPSAPTLTTNSTTGGTLAAATYFYRIVAVDFNGNTTTPSNELAVTTTGSTSSVTISWPLVSGAYNYRIYRGITSGGQNLYYTVTGTNTTSFTDTGAAGTAGTTPTVNLTAYGSFANTSGSFRSGNITIVNNGVGNTSQIVFDKSTDSPAINVVEYASDSTMFEFSLADNPDGSPDFFNWVLPDWQNPSTGWKPLKFGDFTQQFIAQTSNFWSTFLLPSSTPYYTTGPASLSNSPNKFNPFTSTTYNLIKDAGSGTGVFNVDVTGFTGTGYRIYWVTIQTGATTFNWGTGFSGSAPIGTGVAITGGWQLLDNGVQVRITGAVLATDRWSFRAFPMPKLGIGTSTPNASSVVDITSTTKGFLPPRMTNAQRLAIASPAVGLIVYCTDSVEGLYINKSTGWTFII